MQNNKCAAINSVYEWKYIIKEKYQNKPFQFHYFAYCVHVERNAYVRHIKWGETRIAGNKTRTKV